MQEHARDAADQDEGDARREASHEERTEAVEEGLEESEAEPHGSAENGAVRGEAELAAERDDTGSLQGLLDERGEDEHEEERTERRVPVEEDELGLRELLTRRGPDGDDDPFHEGGGDRGEHRPVDERPEERAPRLSRIAFRAPNVRKIEQRGDERDHDEDEEVEDGVRRAHGFGPEGYR